MTLATTGWNPGLGDERIRRSSVGLVCRARTRAPWLLILSIHTVSATDGLDIFLICATKPIAVLLSVRPSCIGCHSFDGQRFTGDEDWVALARPAYGDSSAEIIFTRLGSFHSSLAQTMPRRFRF